MQLSADQGEFATAVATYCRRELATITQRDSVTNLIAGRLEAIALSEPGAGSDLTGLRPASSTRA